MSKFICRLKQIVKLLTIDMIIEMLALLVGSVPITNTVMNKLSRIQVGSVSITNTVMNKLSRIQV